MGDIQETVNGDDGHVARSADGDGDMTGDDDDGGDDEGCDAGIFSCHLLFDSGSSAKACKTRLAHVLLWDLPTIRFTMAFKPSSRQHAHQAGGPKKSRPARSVISLTRPTPATPKGNCSVD